MVSHEEGEVFLGEGGRGELFEGLGVAEEQFDEWNDGDEGEEVEEDCQHVEEQVGADVPGVELEVSEYAPDVVHGSSLGIRGVAG